MKAYYTVPCGRNHIAIADVSDLAGLMGISGWIVNRINVPKPYRGQGLGSQLLRKLCDDADELGETLILEPLATGGLTQEQLIAWYERYGFQTYPDFAGGISPPLLVRKPR